MHYAGLLANPNTVWWNQCFTAVFYTCIGGAVSSRRVGVGNTVLHLRFSSCRQVARGGVAATSIAQDGCYQALIGTFAGSKVAAGCSLRLPSAFEIQLSNEPSGLRVGAHLLHCEVCLPAWHGLLCLLTRSLYFAASGAWWNF
jgi:hypothetical protein